MEDTGIKHTAIILMVKKTKEDQMSRKGLSLRIAGYLFFMSLLTLTVGCDKNSTASNGSSASPSANQDAAEVASESSGENSGGAADEMGDLAEMTNGNNNSAAKVSAEGTVSTKVSTYDSLSGTWTIEIERELATGLVDAQFSRTYNVRFLNSLGVAQKFYITDGDTAYSIEFDIMSGSGHFRTPHLSHVLTNLQGEWLATGTNTNTITVNGTYTRSAVDTIKTLRAVRTSDYTVSLTLDDVTFPRGSRNNISKYLSGTMSGSYNADISFLNGQGYAEGSVSRDFTITFDNGESMIAVGGDVYIGIVASGELSE